MAAVAVDITEAVKTELESAELTTKPDVIERSYANWKLALEGGTDLRIDVVPNTVKQRHELGTRGKRLYTTVVDIAIRQKLDQGKQDDSTGRINVSVVDALMLLVEEVSREVFAGELNRFRGRQLARNRTCRVSRQRTLARLAAIYFRRSRHL